MLIVTTNGIPGYRVEAVLGAVMGMTVRGSSISQGLRGLAGGESAEFTKLVYEARNEVLNRLWGECVRRGGNAVVALRFDTGEVGSNLTEFCGYGTAIVATPIPEGEPGATPQSLARASAMNPGPGNWPRMEGQLAPEDGVREQAAPTAQGQQRPPAPVPNGPQAQQPPSSPSSHDQPSREHPAVPDQHPVADQRAGADRHPGADQRPERRPTEPERRPTTPGEQRPNTDQSWLDLG